MAPGGHVARPPKGGGKRRGAGGARPRRGLAAGSQEVSVVGIGIDVVDVGRMARAVERGGGRFRRRVFSERENAWARGKPDAARRYALCFAAKEAVFKALGTGWPRGGKLTEVELFYKDGSPALEITGVTRDILDGRRVASIEVTTSGDRRLAVCLVLLSR
jgi:holo-[acyl-carrier protein] synthase